MNNENAVRNFAAIIALLFIGTILVFWPATQAAFLNYDDPQYVTNNPHIKEGLSAGMVKWAFTSTHASNWHPLTWFSHAIDWQLFGTKPSGHHFTSILLHALNAVLVFLLLQKTTGRIWCSAFVAAAFAWHPMRVESVAWIAERKDVLSTFLGLISLLFYSRYASRTSLAAYGLSLCFFCVGLLSKPMLVTLPFLMLLLDFWPLNRLSNSCRASRLVLEKLPYFGLSLAVSIVTYIVQQKEGSVRTFDRYPLPDRLQNAFLAYTDYIGKTMWPKKLAVLYLFPESFPLLKVLVAIFLFLAVSISAILIRRRFPFVFVGWFWFVGMLVPVIGIIQVGSQSMADRYSYMPSVGLLVLFCWGAAHILGPRRQNRLLIVIGLLLPITCIAVTRRQLPFWQNSRTLFTRAIEVDPRNYIALNNLGDTYSEERNHERAAQLFAAAALLKPSYTTAHYNLGNSLLALGKTHEAIDEFKLATQLDPKLAEAHVNLGNAYARIGDAAAAISALRTAIVLNPDSTKAHYNLAVMLERTKNLHEAVEEYSHAARLDPTDLATHMNLANVLEKLGQMADARLHFETAVRLSPNDSNAHYRLARALLSQGQPQEARTQFELAIRIALANGKVKEAEAIQQTAAFLFAHSKENGSAKNTSPHD